MELAMFAHLWAHQKQDYASNSGGNFYNEALGYTVLRILERSKPSFNQ